MENNIFWDDYLTVQSEYESYVDFLEKSLKKWESPSKNLGTIELLGIHPDSCFHKKSFHSDKFNLRGNNIYKNLQLLKFPITAKIVDYKSEHGNCPLIIIPNFPILYCDLSITHFMIQDDKSWEQWNNFEKTNNVQQNLQL